MHKRFPTFIGTRAKQNDPGQASSCTRVMICVPGSARKFGKSARRAPHLRVVFRVRERWPCQQKTHPPLTFTADKYPRCNIMRRTANVSPIAIVFAAHRFCAGQHGKNAVVVFTSVFRFVRRP